MTTANKRKSRTRVEVTRDPSPGLQITLKMRFDPDEIGTERTKPVYTAIAQIARAVLDEEDIPELLRQFDELRQATRAGGTTE